MSAASIPSVLCTREGGKERRERRRKGRKERDGDREGGREAVCRSAYDIHYLPHNY